MEKNFGQFYVKAFFDQFPFLTTTTDSQGRPLVDEGRAENVRVSRIDPELLANKPYQKSVCGSLTNVDDNEYMFLLDKDGNFLLEVKAEWESESFYGHEGRHYGEGETVGEALLRLDDPNQVFYVVSVHTGHDIQEHHSVGGYDVVVYKSPKGMDLKTWVEEQIQRASAHLGAVIAEIDAEGVTA